MSKGSRAEEGGHKRGRPGSGRERRQGKVQRDRCIQARVVPTGNPADTAWLVGRAVLWLERAQRRRAWPASSRSRRTEEGKDGAPSPLRLGHGVARTAAAAHHATPHAGRAGVTSQPKSRRRAVDCRSRRWGEVHGDDKNNVCMATPRTEGRCFNRTHHVEWKHRPRPMKTVLIDFDERKFCTRVQ